MKLIKAFPEKNSDNIFKNTITSYCNYCQVSIGYMVEGT